MRLVTFSAMLALVCQLAGCAYGIVQERCERIATDQASFDACLYDAGYGEPPEPPKLTLEAKCEDETKATGSVAYYACLDHYRKDEDRAAEQERYESEVWADAIRKAGEAFKPMPTTTCATKRTPYNTLETVCH